MEMQQIRYFLALARTLNFTRAAEECNVSQSALTRAIQALEAELGGELIRREHSRSHLTELGKRMLPLVERCYESAATAKALARSIAKADLTPLAIAISDSVNVEWMMGPIAEMFRAFPGLQLTILHGGGAEILERLKQGEVEIAIAGPIEDAWERLDHWLLFEEHFELAIGESHPLALENDIVVAKLEGQQLFCQRGCESRESAMRMLAERGAENLPTHDVVTHQDMMALVARNVGVAIVPRSAPRAAGVARAPLSDLPLTRTVSTYAVAGRRRGPVATAFLNLLRSTDFAEAA